MKVIWTVFLVVFQLNQALSTFSADLDEAKAGEVPHHLSVQEPSNYLHLEWSWRHRCGAVLINKQQALTSARCMPEHVEVYKNMRIQAGMHDMTKTDNTQAVKIKKVVLHPEFLHHPSTITASNDLAIITFATPLKLNDNVKAIDWNQDENVDFVGSNCMVSGYGVFKKVMFVFMTTAMSNENCKMRMVEKRGKVYPGHLCAFNSTIERSSCLLDTGSPITCEHEGKQVVAGIYSWGVEAPRYCFDSYPEVFSRTSHFKKFILDNLLQSIIH